MRAPGCCSSCLVPALLLLLSLASADGEGKPGKEGESPGNFMEDEQWLSSISQYSGKIKHWNRFRDMETDQDERGLEKAAEGIEGDIQTSQK
nr:testican-2-like [Anolis sagrei ordinatus]